MFIVINFANIPINHVNSDGKYRMNITLVYSCLICGKMRQYQLTASEITSIFWLLIVIKIQFIVSISKEI